MIRIKKTIQINEHHSGLSAGYIDDDVLHHTELGTPQGGHFERSIRNKSAASSVTIKRHVKIRAEATPYDRRFMEYLEKRGYNSFKGGVKRG